MLITPAFAQATSGAPADGGLFGAGGIASLLPLVLIFVVFYFLLIRPQQKKVKEHKALVAALRRGDRVVTSGGIIGTVTKVLSDSELQLEIAEGVRVRVMRGTVTDVLSKTAPVDDEGETEEAEERPASSAKSK